MLNWLYNLKFRIGLGVWDGWWVCMCEYVCEPWNRQAANCVQMMQSPLNSKSVNILISTNLLIIYSIMNSLVATLHVHHILWSMHSTENKINLTINVIKSNAVPLKNVTLFSSLPLKVQTSTALYMPSQCLVS